MKVEPSYVELKQRVEELESDLVQWHQTKELLDESEELHRHLVESARDVIYSVSPTAEILSVNPAFEQTTGWSPNEMIGKQLTALVHPDDWALAMDMGLRTLNGERTPVHEVRLLTKSGEYAACEFLIAPLMRRGEIIAILGIGRDIRDKKQLEEALRESEARYRGIFNFTKNGVAVYRAINAGEDFVFTDINQAAEQIGRAICRPPG